MMKKKKLQIKVNYEKNRLAEIYLANAYEKLIPITRKIIHVEKIKNNRAEEIIEPLLGGNLK